MTYRDRLYPWCIIRQLPNFQRITVARFRKRNEAEEHLIVLRRLLPQATFVVIFDVQIDENSPKVAHPSPLPKSTQQQDPEQLQRKHR